MEAVTGSGLNSIQFENDPVSKLSPISLPSNSFEASFMSDNLLMSVSNLSSSVFCDSNSPYVGTGRAIFTILLPSSQILVVNSAACQMINYSSDELCSMKLDDLIQESHKHKLSILLEDFCSDLDELPCNSGQILEFLRKDGENVPVSLYLKKIDNPQKCLAIAETLDQRTGLISVDQNGKILSCDEEMALIFQYDASELVGINIHNLLPAINLCQGADLQWSEVTKQYITGRTKNGDFFPLSVTISYTNTSSKAFKVVICLYNCLTGLIILNRKLLIVNFNHYFIKLLFGFSKKEVINQPVENLIPTFSKSIEKDRKLQTQNGVSNESNLVSWCGKSEPSELSVCSGSSATNDSSRNSKSSIISHSFNCSQSPKQSSNLEIQNEFDFQTLYTVEKDQDVLDYSSSRHLLERKLSNKLLKNDETSHSINEEIFAQEGKFLGFAKHRDGNYIGVKYQVKITAVSDDNFYCIWLSRDLQKFNLARKLSAGMSSSFNTSFDCSLPKDSNCSEQWTRPSTASIMSQCDENLTAGDYAKFYTNIRDIGKGAFGYVKMGFRNLDGLLVVTKFIDKKKINIGSWVFHSDLNIKIPLEISLLKTLEHPNIVKGLDVFHNDSYVQLVMEKHGAGIDLFEFINRGPKCDEKLKSYIFRQIISAVHHLDSLGILHRDIKDENVIINEKFEIKLIDFGSAAFKPTDKSFSNFFGTVEYCSPEVLQGNTYKGPELEIWALGVTLYILTFGENPFYDIEETIKGEFSIPSPISEELDSLLHKMLDKNVETRITIGEVSQNPWITQPVTIENYRFDEVIQCSEEEMYPPKFVYEIRSEDIYSRRDSGGDDSDQLAETNNSNSSLQNTAADDLGDLDDDLQELHKAVVPEVIRDRNSVSPVLFTSTPLQRGSRSDRLYKSALGLRKGLENSNSLAESNQESRDSNLAETEFSLDKSSALNESGDEGRNEVVSPAFTDSLDADLEIRFRNFILMEKDKLKGKNSSPNDNGDNISQEIYEVSSDNVCEERSVAEDGGANEYCNSN